MDGLMKFMDLHRPPHMVTSAEYDLDDELANRYVLLYVTPPSFVHS
jgi:hypothetical protein